MCDYSLHAVASRPAVAAETLVVTAFRNTSTIGFASKDEPSVAVCMLPGTELAFEGLKYQSRWGFNRKIRQTAGVFNKHHPEICDRHHDAIEFPDGESIMIQRLCVGQQVKVVQLPVSQEQLSALAKSETTIALLRAPART